MIQNLGMGGWRALEALGPYYEVVAVSSPREVDHGQENEEIHAFLHVFIVCVS